ncbi:type II toxin-antitoxin system death-on-curing family toxin [Phototrophicus methaneseepsis]|uniref:Type II toxin-antitoxin system death-on-curing family toxin n=1 Tax=Phototrophicus methaneseepsis TaxID=2710758 RepID=A0A7S8ECK5_9CHLR|nr:type II toxin-antitoxin system death-on-curing family toxin [Phototrophicus methaneseepsis]QPC84444.1 type II toxin-antitoxin system death-on-curing family toxin [Phototrophicus methaneseepsis]
MNSQNDKDDKPIVYLTVNDLYNINEEVTNGLPYVRERHLLRSAANRPLLSLYGQPQFPTLLDKAAATMHSLAYHHLFADGNKRTAVRAVELFLGSNGVVPTWTDDEIRQFTLEVAQGRIDTPEIATWLADHTRLESSSS